MTGTASIDQYNAGEETFHMNFNDAVIYVNPYFTITPRNYTSHIMNGSQRIATRIETNGLTNCIDTANTGAERIANARAYMQTLFAQGIELRPDTTATFVTNAGNSYDELQWQCVEDDLAWDITLQCDSNLLLTTSHNDSTFIDTISSGIYYYYTDHLGSASWITEGGEPVQYIHYMPYGELWRNQRNTTYDERYKFTGKERDEETGYDFFGARSYSSAITSWLSVDPLSDKYPSVSPYAYCNWNPVRYVDPDGRYFDEANEGTAQKIETELLTKKIYSALGDGNQMRELYYTWKDIKDMRNDGKNEYRFELDKNKPGTTGKEEDGHQIITMYSNLETLDETVAHEVRHGGQTARGEISYDNNNQIQNYDVEKEVDAYRAQWGWRGSPLQIPIDDGIHPMPVPANANYLDITNKLIKSITNGWLDKNDKLYNFK
ncbi:MAG: RHS repeat-associated core domain-containing protein [Paludibacteraceae bacterium]|nr:RHS repeat-associated core domain-containing protein [Paludibacteraceae bacterium]